MRARSILLLDAASPFAWYVVRCLSVDPTLRIHVLARSARIGLRYSRLLTSFAVWGGVLSPTAVEDVRTHVRRVDADLVIAADETPIAFLAAHGADLGAPSMLVPTRCQFDVAQDKWAFAQFLGAHGLPHPPTTLCGSDATARARLAALPFPALVKPRVNGFGRGIRLFESAMSLLAYVTARASDPGDLEVQSYVNGYDIDCSVLCRDGEILAHTIQQPFTRATNFTPAGGVEFVCDDRVLAVTRATMAALKWNGVAHLDLRYDTTRHALVLLEINPRFWGSLLGSLHAGVNFPLLTLRASLGESFDPPSFRACRYVSATTAILFWRSGRFGMARAGFRVTDTGFRYAWCDLLAWIAERIVAPLPPVPPVRKVLASADYVPTVSA